MKQFPDYKQYAKDVMTATQEVLPAFDQEEVKSYLAKKETQEIIARRYKSDLQEYEEGKFPITPYGDCVASVAMCLSMMF